MCDYSLAGIKSRLAVEGDELVTYRFPTNSMGLASLNEVPFHSNLGDCRTVLGTAWKLLKMFAVALQNKPVTAVCIPPGARLLLQDIPSRFCQDLKIDPQEEVTFTQLTAKAYTYRDAVRFNNGHELRIQLLSVGQRVKVLSLASQEDRSSAGPEFTLADIRNLG